MNDDEMNDSRFPSELDKLYRRIFSGVSWPGQRPGFICIVGELRQPIDHKFSLINEIETFNAEVLIAKAGAFDYFYRPEKWISGEINKATKKLLMEFNKQPDTRKNSRKLRIVPSRLKALEDEIFRYIYPKLKRMVSEEGELDISRGKLLLNYLSIIQDSEISSIKIGDFPAIESLAFAIVDLEAAEKSGQTDKTIDNEYDLI